jgi:alpha-galactosidase
MAPRIVLVGAGSAQFGYGMLGDIMQSKAVAGSTIVLHDINRTTLAAVASTARTFVEAGKHPFVVEATTDRAAALDSADYVVISIEVGDRFTLWDQDRTIPQQYGITQIYGENGGPGGVFHSLRIIPPILEICADIEAQCPEAVVFCYSNPMTAICTTVHRKYPDLKFYGMCHEIASLKRYLPDMLGTSYENLHLTAAGLNHFSVLLEAKYVDSGRDAYPDIREKAPGFFEREPGYSDIWKRLQKQPDLLFLEGSEQRAPLDAARSEKPWADRTLFRFILEQFDLLPITVDSHFGEYIAWAYELADHKGILDFLTFYQFMLANMKPEIDLTLRERVVPILDGIESGSGYREEAVNVPNEGLIPELPGFVAVEVPCRVDENGISPAEIPPLPQGYAALLRNYCGVYDLTAEAVIQRSRKLATQAILVNPVVHTVANIDELVTHMIDLQPHWLGYLE